MAMGPYTLGRQRQPTLKLVADLLQQASLDLESALEEKLLLLAKVKKCAFCQFPFLHPALYLRSALGSRYSHSRFSLDARSTSLWGDLFQNKHIKE
jgi:hypothetical protein